MALIPYPGQDELTPADRERIDAFERERGRLSLLRRMLAHYSPALGALDTMYRSIMTQGKLDHATKELIFVASSSQRGCFY